MVVNLWEYMQNALLRNRTSMPHVLLCPLELTDCKGLPVMAQTHTPSFRTMVNGKRAGSIYWTTNTWVLSDDSSITITGKQGLDLTTFLKCHRWYPRPTKTENLWFADSIDCGLRIVATVLCPSINKLTTSHSAKTCQAIQNVAEFWNKIFNLNPTLDC